MHRGGGLMPSKKITAQATNYKTHRKTSKNIYSPTNGKVPASQIALGRSPSQKQRLTAMVCKFKQSKIQEASKLAFKMPFSKKYRKIMTHDASPKKWKPGFAIGRNRYFPFKKKFLGTTVKPGKWRRFATKQQVSGFRSDFQGRQKMAHRSRPRG